MTIGYHIFQLNRRIRRFMDVVMRNEMGITSQQAQVLGAITHGHASQCELEEELGVRRSTISGIIDTMERNGLVERVANPRDKRAKRLVLTAQGRNLSARCSSIMSELDNHFASDLGTEYVEQLHQLLGVMERTLEALHA
ncbi:MAG: MarR family winged helix-turn-helix transcriptional regulator [Sphaerochaetaceae bacterium]|nr:MarR family winged helix-turn-helix transcriptional regulator [Spirochaetales bacterium]MDY5500294.1 MarR family winged helix-turn-helix transcriptional regulator [Sphaerochaetaceae bacterium]